jgi:xanthine dehydrogenase accessory factor
MIGHLAPELLRWLRQGRPVALATVVGVRGSAPRPVGTCMAVTRGGAVAGAVSGGCVEATVREAAQRLLSDGEPLRPTSQLLSFDGNDELIDPVLPCGGGIDVLVERVEPQDLLAQYAEWALSTPPVALVSRTGNGRRSAHLLVEPSGAVQGDLAGEDLRAGAALGARALADELSEPCLDPATGLLVRVAQRPSRLVLVGIGDIAEALARYALSAGYAVTVVDPRVAVVEGFRLSESIEIAMTWPSSALPAIGLDRRTALIAMSHDPKIDDDALVVALRSSAGFVGAMGSRRAANARLERLREAGLTDAELDRLQAPVGLDLGAVGPEHTAVSVLAALIAHAHGRAGGLLARSPHPIHGRT